MADVSIKKAERKEYALIKPLRIGGKLIEPAVSGNPPVMVSLRKDQAKRLGDGGYIKLS